ncbi:MAG: AAA family ATPase [Thermoplasmata archaeon]|nr:AAA family ATPase [Thermoplasmata archaeon]
MTALVVRKKSKFSGRERERERFRAILNEVAEGRGRVVLVEGEAGIGKTRFVEEVSKLPEADQFYQLSTRCVYFEAIDPYLPFKELYFRYREIVKGMEGEGATAYPETAESEEEAPEPVPLSLLPLMLEEGGESAELEEPTPERRVEFVFDLEKRGPVLIFIDDVHWIDRASLNLIKYLSTRIEEKRILLIAAYRPEDLYLDREKTKALMETLKSLGRERITEKIVLGHLDKRSVEEILKDQLEVNKLPEGLLEEIYKNSGGNPFFVEEILFSLISQGILFPGVVDKDVMEKIKRAEIPSTLSDLIARRYDSLTDDARRLVRTAAVIGLEAGIDLLQRVVELEGERLLDALEELQITHFLEEGKGDEGVYYRFKNSIIQEFIYQNLSLSRRRYLHNKIAGVMEELYRNRPTFYNTIAIHYFNGENFPMAARYYTMAANAILKKNPADAVDYYEKALAIYRDMKEEKPEEYLNTLMNIITILIEMGDIGGVERYLTEIETFLGKRKSEFRQYWLKTRHRLGELLILKGELNDAKKVLGGAIERENDFQVP